MLTYRPISTRCLDSRATSQWTPLDETTQRAHWAMTRHLCGPPVITFRFVPAKQPIFTMPFTWWESKL